MSDNIIQLNEQVIKTELKDLVKQSVEETLNSLLDQEAEELTHAEKYERTNARKGYRSGHYTRNLQTTSGNISLKVPKLKGIPFETAIIERYRRRESSVEEAPHRDVLGWRFRTSCRRYHRSPLGIQSVAGHHQQP